MISRPSTKKLFYKLFFTILTLVIIVISACAFVSYSIIDRTYRKGVERLLSDSADFVSSLLLNGTSRGALSEICRSYSQNMGIRTTIVCADGDVFLDTDFDESNMSNHSARREISAALSGKRNIVVRYSATLNKAMMYIAIPAGEKRDGQYPFCVRQSILMSNLSEVENLVLAEIALFIAIAFAFALASSIVLARKISYPIRQLTDIASELSKENFDVKIPSYDVSELQLLAQTFDAMAKVIRKKIHSLNKRNLELDEIFENMSESVFICSKDERVRRYNRSCAELFSIDASSEAVNTAAAFRNTSILHAIDEVFRLGKFESEIEIGPNKIYQFIGGVLPYESKTPRALVVMRDVSMQKRNESLRKEFVAGVSHELKTPITSIKMAAETIAGSCDIKDAEALHFIELISKEAGRMNLLVDDMLLLSRIEFNQMFGTETFEDINLRSAIEESVSQYDSESNRHSDKITFICPSDLSIRGNYTLLQMALGNLISNAIKYAGHGVEISIESGRIGGKVFISVQDNGAGIPDEDLPRIFERFYRVDKGRSRNLGGTGLGLAIVKHIAILHGGTVTAESKLGKGSKFTILI